LLDSLLQEIENVFFIVDYRLSLIYLLSFQI